MAVIEVRAKRGRERRGGAGPVRRGGARCRRRGRQLALPIDVSPPRRWGGQRPGAGRKPAGSRPGVSHGPRTRVVRLIPIHVVCRVVREMRHLRGFRTYPIVRRALVAAADRFDVRIAHFSIQGNHIHLIVEVASEWALGRAMKGLEVRIARGLNRAAGRRGRVFADRYFARHLTTPTEVRRALVYVLANGAKHAGAERSRLAPTWMDPYSSACYFTGWTAACARRLPVRDAPDHPLHTDPDQRGRPFRPPVTWLLREGWQRAGGLLDTRERPRT